MDHERFSVEIPIKRGETVVYGFVLIEEGKERSLLASGTRSFVTEGFEMIINDGILPFPEASFHPLEIINEDHCQVCFLLDLVSIVLVSI